MTTDSNAAAQTTGGVPPLRRVLVTGGAGFIGSNLVDRLLAYGCQVTAYDNLSTGQPTFLEQASAHPAFRLVEADLLDAGDAPRGDGAGTTSCSTSPPTPTSASAPTTRAATWSRTSSPPTTCWRRCGSPASRRIAFSSTGSIYGEPDGLPDARGRAVPDPDLALRRLQAGRRGADRGVLRGVRLPGAHLPLRLGPRRAVHPRPRLRLLQEAAGRPDPPPRCWGTASSASRTCTSRTASTRCCWRSARSTEKVDDPQPRHRRVRRGQRLDSAGSSTISGINPELQYAGGERGWIGDSPFIFLDYRQGPRARLAAEAVDPRGRREDRPVPARPAVARWSDGERGGMTGEVVCVYGLWHLGCVTAACLAGRRHPGRRAGPGRAAASRSFRPAARRSPSPGWPELVQEGLASGRLSFTSDPAAALAEAGILWVTFDTPVDDDDQADVAWVRAQLEAVRPHLQPDTLVLVSSQVPVGFTPGLERDWRQHDPSLQFACTPENLRLGRAIEVFRQPGARRPRDRRRRRPGAAGQPVRAVLGPDRVDVARVGRDDQARAERLPGALRRVHQRAGPHLRAGRRRRLRGRARPAERAEDRAARLRLAGAADRRRHAAQDIGFLASSAAERGLQSPVVDAVRTSNQLHQEWASERALELLRGIERAARGRARPDLQARHRHAAPLVRRSSWPGHCSSAASRSRRTIRPSARCRPSLDAIDAGRRRRRRARRRRRRHPGDPLAGVPRPLRRAARPADAAAVPDRPGRLPPAPGRRLLG